MGQSWLKWCWRPEAIIEKIVRVASSFTCQPSVWHFSNVFPRGVLFHPCLLCLLNCIGCAWTEARPANESPAEARTDAATRTSTVQSPGFRVFPDSAITHRKGSRTRHVRIWPSAKAWRLAPTSSRSFCRRGRHCPQARLHQSRTSDDIPGFLLHSTNCSGQSVNGRLF